MTSILRRPRSRGGPLMDSGAHRTKRTLIIAAVMAAPAAVHPLSPAPAGPSQQPPSTAPAPAPVSADLAQAVRDLGDESFEVRERASKVLWSAGEAARGALKRAAEGDDPEVAGRAAKILANLDL